MPMLTHTNTVAKKVIVACSLTSIGEKIALLPDHKKTFIPKGMSFRQDLGENFLEVFK